ncbi:MAG: DNA topoisomerase, partial [Clostridia bacterium]|nr:DNA topoisomerase [Clostridia bacterium]
MIVKSFDGTTERSIRFRRGEVNGELQERPLSPKEKRTGTVVLWRPDLKVFTDINIPHDFFRDVLHRQSVVNPGISFLLFVEQEDESFTEEKFVYENGIADYLNEKVGEAGLTAPVSWHLETQGRDREDLDEYKFKADVSFCVSNTVNMLEYYHNSSFLEYGGSPDRAVRLAFTYALDKYLKA